MQIELQADYATLASLHLIVDQSPITFRAVVHDNAQLAVESEALHAAHNIGMVQCHEQLH